MSGVDRWPYQGFYTQEWITTHNRIDALLCELKACHADKAQLEARLKEAEELLRDHEWEADDGFACMECGSDKDSSSHGADCKLAAFLKGSV